MKGVRQDSDYHTDALMCVNRKYECILYKFTEIEPFPDCVRYLQPPFIIGQFSTRIRTQKGDMLFELKRDPSACQELVAKSLGNEVSIRALSQEAVIECRKLDEITIEGNVRGALLSQCSLEEAPQSNRLRKA